MATWLWPLLGALIYEPEREKTYFLTCATKCAFAQCDQILHCPQEKLLILCYSKCTQWIFLSDCAGWSESSLDAHVRRYVFWRCGSYIWASAWQNQQTSMCAQRRLRSAWASAQSDQSLRYALNGEVMTQAFFMRTEGSDQTGRMSRLIWVFAGRACHLVAFVMRWLIFDARIWHKDPFARFASIVDFIFRQVTPSCPFEELSHVK